MDNPKFREGTTVRILVPRPEGTIIERRYFPDYKEYQYKVQYVDEQGKLVWNWYSAYELELTE
jgi:hypothetical protein